MQSNLRVPPHDLMIEEAILGALLINPKCKPKVSTLICKDDFYREANQNIFESICEAGSDILLVANRLTEKNELEKSGGVDYLSHIVESVGSSAGVEQYCHKLRELSNKRWLIGQCSHIASAAFYDWEDFESLLSIHRTEIINRISIQTESYQSPQRIKQELMTQIETANAGKLDVTKTGFRNIDEYIMGLEPKTVTGIIARPSMGKSSIALNIADNIAISKPYERVLFFSLESNAMALMRRRLSTFSHIFLSKLRAGDIKTDGEWERVTQGLNKIPDNLIIFESSKFKQIEALSAMAETMALEKKVSLIVIDHLQKMATSQKTYSRANEVGTISNKITTLAKDINVPVLVLCQLNRESEKGGTPRAPTLPDIRESGDVEQDFDIILGLFRKGREDEWTQLECLKGRDTGTWKSYLKFNRFIQKFSDCDEAEGKYYFTGSYGG